MESHSTCLEQLDHSSIQPWRTNSSILKQNLMKLVHRRLEVWSRSHCRYLADWGRLSLCRFSLWLRILHVICLSRFLLITTNSRIICKFWRTNRMALCKLKWIRCLGYPFLMSQLWLVRDWTQRSYQPLCYKYNVRLDSNLNFNSDGSS